MGYNHASAFAEPPLTLEQTKECVEYLMVQAAQRFLNEFPQCNDGQDLNTEIDADARTVKVWASGHWRVYAFDALL